MAIAGIASPVLLFASFRRLRIACSQTLYSGCCEHEGPQKLESQLVKCGEHIGSNLNVTCSQTLEENPTWHLGPLLQVYS